MITCDIISDWTMWTYVLTLLVCAYGAGLFAWWARKAGKPSAVFLYVMGIFFAEGFTMVLAIYSRLVLLYAEDLVWYSQLHNSWQWAFRGIPLLLVLTALAAHMSVRAFIKKSRRDDRDKHLIDEVCRVSAEAALAAAEVVATASAEAAKKVADEAKRAARNAQAASEHIILAIRNIQHRRGDD